MNSTHRHLEVCGCDRNLMAKPGKFSNSFSLTCSCFEKSFFLPMKNVGFSFPCSYYEIVIQNLDTCRKFATKLSLNF